MIHSILYKSKAQADFSSDQIRDMLRQAKRFNKENNITGCIIYYDAQFIQLIEGAKECIQALYKSIQADNRHYDIQTLLNQPSPRSLWTSWSMAFYDFSNLNEQSNYIRLLLESSFENAAEKEKNSVVLSTFKQHTIQMLSI